MATAEQNMETTRKSYQAIPGMKDGDFSFIEETASPDHILHDPSAPDLPPGLQATKEYLQSFAVAFPDMRFSVENIFASASGDEVVSRWVMEGTNDGPMQGMEPTGNRVRVEGMTMDRYGPDGKLAETWNVWDTLSFAEQLGAQPPAQSRSAEDQPGAH